MWQALFGADAPSAVGSLATVQDAFLAVRLVACTCCPSCTDARCFRASCAMRWDLQAARWRAASSVSRTSQTSPASRTSTCAPSASGEPFGLEGACWCTPRRSAPSTQSLSRRKRRAPACECQLSTSRSSKVRCPNCRTLRSHSSMDALKGSSEAARGNRRFASACLRVSLCAPHLASCSSSSFAPPSLTLALSAVLALGGLALGTYFMYGGGRMAQREIEKGPFSVHLLPRRAASCSFLYVPAANA